MINPENIGAETDKKNGEISYPTSISDRVPTVLKILSLIYLSLGLIGIYCIKPFVSAEGSQDSVEDRELKGTSFCDQL